MCAEVNALSSLSLAVPMPLANQRGAALVEDRHRAAFGEDRREPRVDAHESERPVVQLNVGVAVVPSRDGRPESYRSDTGYQGAGSGQALAETLAVLDEASRRIDTVSALASRSAESSSLDIRRELQSRSGRKVYAAYRQDVDVKPGVSIDTAA